MACDFKPTRKGPRDNLFVAMPPLEAKKALFACVAGVRVMLMLVDGKNAHFNAKCDEDAWRVEKSRILGQVGDRVAESGGFDPRLFLNEQIGKEGFCRCPGSLDV